MQNAHAPVFDWQITGSSRNLGGKSSLGARLRTRKVTSRDASLPAPLLAACLGLVGRGTVGALPQTPQGTLSLDPFSRLSWSRFHAPSACSFLALRLSPCLLPQLSVKNPKNPPLCAEGDAVLRHFEFISRFINRFDARFAQFPPQTLNVHVHRAGFA
mgnify:CR=1 FL=1